jgi:hypothetical protein
LIMNTDGSPGLYCIASDSWLMGSPNKIVVTAGPPTTLVTDPDVIDKPGAGLPETNHACIVAMVIWPDTNRTMTHYLGGDVDWVMESRVARWTGDGSTNPADRVRGMKLSHHGAAMSSPVDMIQRFYPDRIIISAGSQYGHPRKYISQCDSIAATDCSLRPLP